MNFSYEANETLSLLWRATWQSTVLALLVAATILVSRRWLAPKWRVLLWMLPLCRMLLLVVPASGLSIFNGINYLAEPRTALPILSAIDNDLPPFRELNAAPLNAPSSLHGTFRKNRCHALVDSFFLPPGNPGNRGGLRQCILRRGHWGRDSLHTAAVESLVVNQSLGERQAEAYLPRERFGRTSISYDGSFSERVIRLLISFISCFGTMTPVG